MESPGLDLILMILIIQMSWMTQHMRDPCVFAIRNGLPACMALLLKNNGTKIIFRHGTGKLHINLTRMRLRALRLNRFFDMAPGEWRQEQACSILMESLSTLRDTPVLKSLSLTLEPQGITQRHGM
jgi:hypothetical protein